LQGDIEKRTGLLRCYVSRVENGHTVPAIETLEKLARALEVPVTEHLRFFTLPSQVVSRLDILQKIFPGGTGRLLELPFPVEY
jgi:transcriptional regulator with XRE-family HTH domain